MSTHPWPSLGIGGWLCQLAEFLQHREVAAGPLIK